MTEWLDKRNKQLVSAGVTRPALYTTTGDSRKSDKCGKRETAELTNSIVRSACKLVDGKSENSVFSERPTTNIYLSPKQEDDESLIARIQNPKCGIN